MIRSITLALAISASPLALTAAAQEPAAEELTVEQQLEAQRQWMEAFEASLDR